MGEVGIVIYGNSGFMVGIIDFSIGVFFFSGFELLLLLFLSVLFERVLDDCERWCVFCVVLSMLLWLKLEVCWILRLEGDLRIELLFGMGVNEEGILMVKFFFVGNGNCFIVVLLGIGGEFFVDEGDILGVCKWVCVVDVMVVVCL